MTSEQKLRCTNTPKTQFLQNFTKKKFMNSSTQKTKAKPNKSPIINPMSPPKSPLSQKKPPNVSFKEALMQDMNIDLESPFEGNAIDTMLTDENQIASKDQPSQGVEKRMDIITLSPQVQDKIYAPWRSSIIIKVIGKSFGYRNLITRLGGI